MFSVASHSADLKCYSLCLQLERTHMLIFYITWTHAERKLFSAILKPQSRCCVEVSVSDVMLTFSSPFRSTTIDHDRHYSEMGPLNAYKKDLIEFPSNKNSRRHLARLGAWHLLRFTWPHLCHRQLLTWTVYRPLLYHESLSQLVRIYHPTLPQMRRKYPDYH